MAFKFNTNNTMNPLEAFSADLVTAKITNAKSHVPTGKTEATSLKVDFKVTEPVEFRGKLITQFFNYKEENLWRLSAFLKALNLEGDIEINDGENEWLTGREVQGTVVSQEQKEYEGKKQPNKSQFISWVGQDSIDTVDSL